ncbi:MAG: hypothetical protein B7Y12_12575 [Rhizobiales bacterium 24-66-13]|nr:MAG: hypothetical protein B7Y12_12575 [Rhizobiales bacterium 24-66-13]
MRKPSRDPVPPRRSATEWPAGTLKERSQGGNERKPMLDISEAISPVQRAEAAATEAKRLSGMVVCEGRLQAALTDHKFEVDNPATARIIGHAPRCGAADVDRAVASASAAFAGWRHLTARDRAAFLVKAAARLESEAEAIAQLSAFETGNALATQTRGEAATMVDILRFFAQDRRTGAAGRAALLRTDAGSAAAGRRELHLRPWRRGRAPAVRTSQGAQGHLHRVKRGGR